MPALGLVACGGRRTAALPYDVMIRNCTSSEVSAVSLAFAGFAANMGVLPPGIGSTYAFVQAPIPDVADLSWRGKDGVVHRVEVAVLMVLPADFARDEVVFQICPGDEVKVEYSVDERSRQARRVEEPPPDRSTAVAGQAMHTS